jgi:hypothetical protein
LPEVSPKDKREKAQKTNPEQTERNSIAHHCDGGSCHSLGLSGTFFPSFLALDSPMAIACFLSVTFLPLRPLLSLPSFIAFISVSTSLEAPGEYFRVEDFFAVDFFAADFFVVDFFAAVFLIAMLFLLQDSDDSGFKASCILCAKWITLIIAVMINSLKRTPPRSGFLKLPGS